MTTSRITNEMMFGIAAKVYSKVGKLTPKSQGVVISTLIRNPEKILSMNSDPDKLRMALDADFETPEEENVFKRVLANVSSHVRNPNKVMEVDEFFTTQQLNAKEKPKLDGLESTGKTGRFSTYKRVDMPLPEVS